MGVYRGFYFKDIFGHELYDKLQKFIFGENCNRLIII